MQTFVTSTQILDLESADHSCLSDDSLIDSSHSSQCRFSRGETTLKVTVKSALQLPAASKKKKQNAVFTLFIGDLPMKQWFIAEESLEKAKKSSACVETCLTLPFECRYVS
jgi:hypothetical protein